MVEILRIAHYSWRPRGGQYGPHTQVTWENDKGQVKVTVLKGTLKDKEKITREVKARRG